jgi:hypothetical protein
MATKRKTPTFLLELPLVVHEGQAKRIRAHLEAARQFYNALLSEGRSRLQRMRADPRWQAARALPRTQKQARQAAFTALREQYGFSQYALHAFAKEARCAWLADHLDAVLAQTLATRAYQALNRVCTGQARRVRFKSRGRGLDSIENKRNDTGLRFVLQPAEEGNQGALLWHDDRLPALIDWHDPVITHGLAQRIKYARLLRRKASSPKAAGADSQGYRYFVQLALEGSPHHKPTHRLHWQTSKGYEQTRRRKAAQERRLAAHRKSLQGRLAHEIVKLGNTIMLEKISYTSWQRRFGKSVGLRAPGMLIAHLRRTVASTGGTLHEVPTRSTKLSQYCHGCGKCVKKALWQRWHACECGIGPVQRDLYSAFLAAYLEPPDILPSCAQYAEYWEVAEARLRAAHERVKERAKAGQVMPQSMGLARARARLPQSSSEPTQEPAFLLRGGRLEAWKEGSEPPLLEHEELSENEREDGEDPSILRRHHSLCDPGCHFQEDAKNY